MNSELRFEIPQLAQGKANSRFYLVPQKDSITKRYIQGTFLLTEKQIHINQELFAHDSQVAFFKTANNGSIIN